MLEYQFYKKKATKETVVLLHGIGGTSKIFYKQMEQYNSRFNVLTIHLPGHGNSLGTLNLSKKFSYDSVVEEIVKVLDHLDLKNAHFIGISLGSIIIHHILQSHPQRVKSAVLGGVITRFNLLAKLVFQIGNLIKEFVPFIWLYVSFAHVMMPKNNHKKSREIFIKEAKKMKREDFLSWFNLIGQADKTYQRVQERGASIPKLYLSGKEDHLFVKNLLQDIEGDRNAEVKIIEKCGHVCNIEKPEEFNAASIYFIQNHSKLANVI